MPAHLRLLSWNVRDLLGDPLAVHRVLRAAAADVVLLQEAPRLALSRGRIASIARHSGLLFVCGGHASAGTALLVSLRAEVRCSRAVRLPVSGRLTRPRGYVCAEIGLPGTGSVLVVGIHLGLTAEERADHLQRIVTDVKASNLPAVVAGDLNEPPGGPSWSALKDVVSDPAPDGPPTYSARRPRRRIDAVLASPGLEVRDYGWPDGVSEGDVVLASDHRPVAATVRLP